MIVHAENIKFASAILCYWVVRNCSYVCNILCQAIFGEWIKIKNQCIVYIQSLHAFRRSLEHFLNEWDELISNENVK